MTHLKSILLATLILLGFSPAALAYDEQTYGEMGNLIYSNKPSELQKLLDSGADPNAMQEKITPLGIAIEWKRQECIDILLAHPKINPHKEYTVITRGGSGQTKNKNALLSAIDNGNTEVANRLLDLGVNADFVSKTYNFMGDFMGDTTPLISLYFWDKTPENVALAQRIADKTKEISRVFTYSQYKKEMNALPDTNLIQRLIGDDDDDRTAFNAVTISLMKRGADFKRYFEMSQLGSELVAQYMSASEYAAYKKNQQYVSYTSCLMSAALRGNAELLEYMIDNGASIERYNDGGAVLFCTCINIECIKVLLKQGLSIDTCHPSGMPLLLSAVTAENNDLIDGMLTLGADPFISCNGITVRETMRSYPSKRKKALQKIYKSHGYDL